MDIADEDAVGKVFAGLRHVDHVLISAGTIRNGAIVHNDLATLRRIIDERLWGLTYVVRHAAPRMPQGSITFTSGSLSSRPRPGTAMLTAMLSAVEALAPALALELAPVRVNAVTPGLIDTPLLHTAYGAERDTIVQNRAAILPGKRVGTADEVAQVILMLGVSANHVHGFGRFNLQSHRTGRLAAREAPGEAQSARRYRGMRHTVCTSSRAQSMSWTT
jgi:NAD(P)-dependent dehydrogenase (short-subunit alcohol dehydrogenase family)